MISLLSQRRRAAGHQATAGAGQREATGQVPVTADWLRLARIARMLSWLTLAWMGVEGGVAIVWLRIPAGGAVLSIPG